MWTLTDQEGLQVKGQCELNKGPGVFMFHDLPSSKYDLGLLT